MAMNSSSPELKVFASLPLTVALDTDLNTDPANWRWVHCLTFPLETLNTLQFSQRPYKWIRYAIGVVVGAEGVLSTSSDSPHALEDTDVKQAEPGDLYYHVNNQEKRRMFPVDPHIARTCTTSTSTIWKEDFKNQVIERDGNVCALTKYDKVLCDAVHLVPYSKDDNYILNFTKRRSRDPTGGDIIKTIDSVRNGLLLYIPVHQLLGTDIALLMTPNFAMDTTDLDPAAPPMEKRCTSHVFKDYGPPLGGSLHISDTPHYPPAILFDAVYAGAIVHQFGTQSVKDHVTVIWKDAYPDEAEIISRREAAEKRKLEREEKRAERHAAREEPDILDMLMMMPYIMVPLHERQKMAREAEEKEQSRVVEKVGAWIKEVNGK